ncbi:MAG: response regulator [Candidatus Paceibacterota bacterium]|jgi:DNA-binding response OmpR family regulator
MRILIVEDEQALAKVLEEKLIKSGFEAKIAGDGEAALYAADVFKPEMILLDLILPKKDGFEVLKELKANPSLASIPVIVLSNLGEDENLKKAFALGAKDYFVKSQHPINEIIDKIKNIRVSGK